MILENTRINCLNEEVAVRVTHWTCLLLSTFKKIMQTVNVNDILSGVWF